MNAEPAFVWTPTFDTLKLVKTLRDEANFDQKQAEGVAHAFANIVSNRLVTHDQFELRTQELKSHTDERIKDVELQIAELKSHTDERIKDVELQIAELKSHTDTKIAEQTTKLVLWFVGFNIASMGIFFTLFKLLNLA